MATKTPEDDFDEPLALEFVELYNMIAEAMGGEDNVPKKIGDKIDALYNSAVSWEKAIRDGDDRIDFA